MAIRKRRVLPCPLPAPLRPVIAIGLEGSANKIGMLHLTSRRALCSVSLTNAVSPNGILKKKTGVGLILHSPATASSSSTNGSDPGSVTILSNIRHTYVTPPGEGFLPSDTARHHKRWINEVVERALHEAGKTMEDVDVVCYTKGEHSSIVLDDCTAC